jgi:hypothetical protein
MRKPISQEKRHEWETKIQQQRQSGLSINKWCKENQTPISTFHQWEDRLYPKQKTPLSLKSFTELTEISGSKGAGIFIEYRGIFLNRYRDHMKVLFWDKDGFVIFYKRLEKGTFAWKWGDAKSLDRREFFMLLEGISPKRLQPRFSL